MSGEVMLMSPDGQIRLLDPLGLNPCYLFSGSYTLVTFFFTYICYDVSSWEDMKLTLQSLTQ